MSELEDIDLARRLREHFRATTASEVPSSLRVTVRDGFASDRRRRSWRIGRSGAAVVVALIVVVGGSFIVGTRPVLPAATVSPPAASGGSTAAVSTREPSIGPSASASSGIPGGGAVLQGAAIRDAALAATDDAPFLIGGSIAYVLADCAVPADFPETPLLRVCSDGMVIGNGRGGHGGSPVVSDMLPTGPGLGFNERAVVLRVHTHDERAVTCPPAYLVRCEQAIVVEQVVWRPEAGGSATIPAVLSILPPQVEPSECVPLGFAPARCVAVIERARSIGSMPWPEVTSVRLEPPGPQVTLGSRGIAVVRFHLGDGTDELIDVRCKLSGMRSVVCGPATVEMVPPSSGSPAP